MSEKLSVWRSLFLAIKSRRTAFVSLLSFPSGLPLGLILIAIPDWLASIGTDIRVIGLITLSQAPWAFKILWSPFLDRFPPGFWGRRRGWIAIFQVVLFILTLFMAGLGTQPDLPWIVGVFALAIAFASASQDIVIDAYAVEVLRDDEQGVAVGARTAFYRAAMYLSGGAAISLAGRYSWPLVFIGLAALYVPFLWITWKSPEPEVKIDSPRTLRDAVWGPLMGALSRHRSVEILAFVVIYKLADNFAGALLRPFLVDMGYTADERGIGVATIGLFASLAGVFLGGAATTVIGLGHCLWIFGFLQIFSNIGYVLVAELPPSRFLMFSAMGFEIVTQGMATGAFMVLLLRMTQKRFSATQYALFSSLFAIPRVFTGPISGFLVYALGWTQFFWGTMIVGIPGLLLLHRFSPLGIREPIFSVERGGSRRNYSRGEIVVRGFLGSALTFLFVVLFAILLQFLKSRSSDAPLGILGAAKEALAISDIPGAIAVASYFIIAAIGGLGTAAVLKARSGPSEIHSERRN